MPKDKKDQQSAADPQVSYQSILKEYQELISTAEPTIQNVEERTSLDDELAREKRLKNDDTKQDIELKKKTLNRLFWFLAVETIVIFCFAFLQATRWIGFNLDSWSFRLLTAVTITQVTTMLLVAVSYLFPKKH